MKKILFLFAYLVLGIMMSSCVINETVVNREYYDNLRACEPESDTHYLSWFTTYRGDRLSTSIPYITEHEKNSDYEVIEKDTIVEFKDLTTQKILRDYRTEGNVDVVGFECRLYVNFTNFTSTYYFNVEEHQNLYGTFPLYEPEFELTACDIKPLGMVIEGNKHYCCMEVKLMLKVSQGEKVFEVPKTIMVKERRYPIEFSPSINDWEDENVNTGA